MPGTKNAFAALGGKKLGLDAVILLINYSVTVFPVSYIHSSFLPFVPTMYYRSHRFCTEALTQKKRIVRTVWGESSAQACAEALDTSAGGGGAEKGA